MSRDTRARKQIERETRARQRDEELAVAHRERNPVPTLRELRDYAQAVDYSNLELFHRNAIRAWFETDTATNATIRHQNAAYAAATQEEILDIEAIGAIIRPRASLLAEVELRRLLTNPNVQWMLNRGRYKEAGGSENMVHNMRTKATEAGMFFALFTATAVAVRGRIPDDVFELLYRPFEDARWTR